MTWTESRIPVHNQYNLTCLDIDHAWLNITNLANQTLWLYQLSKDCLECPYTKTRRDGDDWACSYSDRYSDIQLEPGQSTKLVVSTKFPVNYRLERNGTLEIIEAAKNERSTHCVIETNFGEFGVYELLAEGNDCKLKTELEPVSIFLPFLIPFFIYLAIGILTFLLRKYKNKIPGLRKQDQPGDEAQSSTIGASLNSTPRPRLRSLDTFRGLNLNKLEIELCIVVMIFVNDGGAGYYFLEHATWDGLYVADLVFPWFLWIMGVCIPVSIKSQVKRNTPVLTILKRITIRSLKLIAIGLILNTIGGPVQFSKWRLPGVLQRFGICYFVAAVSVLISSSKAFVNNSKENNKYVALVQDIVFIWKGWLISLAALILHTCLTFFLEVPGCPKGYLGPGGLHKGNAYPDFCIGGAAGYIDRKILTLKHIYQWPTAGATYRSSPYDPEGILGTFTSIFTVWLGVQAGLTMQVFPEHKSRLIRWAIWSVVLGAIGAALCGAKQTGGAIPLNKNLWSLSFVLVLSSFALLLLIFLYVVIDILKIWSGTPFFEPGMNSILLYIGHSVANDLLPWHFRLERMDTHLKRLIESLWGTSLWVLYSIYLFHRKYFWSI